MTVWADDKEKESALFSNVQVEIGCDETDLWLTFNKMTSAVQFTHAEARKLIKEMEAAIAEGEQKMAEEMNK